MFCKHLKCIISHTGQHSGGGSGTDGSQPPARGECSSRCLEWEVSAVQRWQVAASGPDDALQPASVLGGAGCLPQ